MRKALRPTKRDLSSMAHQRAAAHRLRTTALECMTNLERTFVQAKQVKFAEILDTHPQYNDFYTFSKEHPLNFGS
jgi:hypothetical protein